jgi:hypothetical protein
MLDTSSRGGRTRTGSTTHSRGPGSAAVDPISEFTGRLALFTSTGIQPADTLLPILGVSYRPLSLLPRSSECVDMFVLQSPSGLIVSIMRCLFSMSPLPMYRITQTRVLGRSVGSHPL